MVGGILPESASCGGIPKFYMTGGHPNSTWQGDVPILHTTEGHPHTLNDGGRPCTILERGRRRIMS